MKTVEQIVEMFPETKTEEWIQKEQAWIHKDAKISPACKIYGGVFRDGEFHDGYFHGGVFHDGYFRDGEFHDGYFHGGVFHYGYFHGGVFHDGYFHGGEFHGGEFHGGEFHGGEFHDGYFYGGVFRGGVFHGGWLPLQIQGSAHFLNIPDGKNIKIGCVVHPPDTWAKEFERIGCYHGYTPEQIKEYKRYIDLATAMIKDNAKNTLNVLKGS